MTRVEKKVKKSKKKVKKKNPAKVLDPHGTGPLWRLPELGNGTEADETEADGTGGNKVGDPRSYRSPDF